MTQVNLERTPFAKHAFYRGVYEYGNNSYDFTLIEGWSENSAKPDIIVEFEEAVTCPFDKQKARQQIVALYLPHGNKEAENKNS